MEIQVKITDSEQFEAMAQAVMIGFEVLVYLGRLQGQSDTADDYRQRILAKLAQSGIVEDL
jgi:small-conductance mechanosensitive channel